MKLLTDRGKWIAAIAAAIILLAGIGWYMESPIYTLGQIRDAAKANDADTLSSYVDYPALRESLKSQIMARMRADARQRDRSGLGSLEVALGSAMIGPLTDAVVSPAGVRAMLLSKQTNEALGNAPKPPVHVDSDVAIERHGLSEFVVKSRSRPQGGIVFKRHWIGWKLSGVELPPA